MEQFRSYVVRRCSKWQIDLFRRKKINTVKRLKKKSENVRFIALNLCIEVWFILHFVYTTHPFKDSKEPKKDLAKYIDGYKESMDIAEVLRPNLEDAKKRIKQLKAYYK